MLCHCRVEQDDVDVVMVGVCDRFSRRFAVSSQRHVAKYPSCLAARDLDGEKTATGGDEAHGEKGRRRSG